MDILKLATELFMNKLGDGTLDAGALHEALGGLLGGDAGQIDIPAILGKLQGGGLAGLASSWLGDGANASLAPAQVLDLFGVDRIEAFANAAGIDGERASNGLAAMLPELVDRCSSGGKLLEAVGGAGGLLGAAAKLFR